MGFSLIIRGTEDDLPASRYKAKKQMQARERYHATKLKKAPPPRAPTPEMSDSDQSEYAPSLPPPSDETSDSDDNISIQSDDHPDWTFLRDFKSKNWRPMVQDTFAWRRDFLWDEVRLWESRWGGVGNWLKIAKRVARNKPCHVTADQMRHHIALGIDLVDTTQALWDATIVEGQDHNLQREEQFIMINEVMGCLQFLQFPYLH